MRLAISLVDIRESLETKLVRKATREELADFLQYLETDAPQWLSDNARIFVRDVPERSPMQE